MLEAIPKRLLSNAFVLRSDGRPVAELEVSAWRERARFRLGGTPYRLYREGWLGAFVMDRGGVLAARAVKPSVLQSRFTVDAGGRSVTLRKFGWFSRRFGVFADGVQVGSIFRPSFFRRRTLVELPADWPVPHQIFVLWLALLIWKREESAGAGAGG